MMRGPIAGLAAVALISTGLGATDLVVLHNQAHIPSAVGWLLVSGAILGGVALAVCVAYSLLAAPSDHWSYRNPAVWLVLIAALAAATITVSSVGLALAARQRIAAPQSRDSAASIDEGPEASFRCGTDRWPVKTLSDPGVSGLSLHANPATVPELSHLKPPSPIGRSLPRQWLERRAYAIDVQLKEARYVGGSSEDRDIHLVVQDVRGGPTMVVEFPDAACPGATDSPYRNVLFKARAEFEQACGGRPPQRFIALRGHAHIRGVAFWDRPHGKDSPRGRAPNSIELHPVTSFGMDDRSRCQRED